MHSYIDLAISHFFKIAARTCRSYFKCYDIRSVLNLPSSTLSRSISLLENLEELPEPSVLSGNPIPFLDASSLAQSITKYTKEDLQHILKMVLEVQAPVPAPIIFLKGL